MLLRYPGSKRKSSKSILSLAPDFAEYREPFAGNASLLWRVPLNKKRWINDIDPTLVRFHTALKSDPKFIDNFLTLKQTLTDLTAAKTAFNNARKQWGETGCQVSYLLLNRLAYGQMVRHSRANLATFAWPEYQNGLNPITEARLRQARRILQFVNITEQDYGAVLNAPGENVWIFVDPPYIWGSRNIGIYDYNFTVDDHYELRDRLRDCPHKWLLTLNMVPLALDLYREFHCRIKRLRYSNCRRKQTRLARELWVTNY